MRKKYFHVCLAAFLFTIFLSSAKAQSESAVDRQLFEIQRVYHAKSDKKKISIKDKKIRVDIRSNYDMGNATLEIVINGQKVKHQIKEIGTESAGSKVKVVTGVIYEIVINTPEILKTGENELLIKGYGLAQSKKFKIKP